MVRGSISNTVRSIDRSVIRIICMCLRLENWYLLVTHKRGISYQVVRGTGTYSSRTTTRKQEKHEELFYCGSDWKEKEEGCFKQDPTKV